VETRRVGLFAAVVLVGVLAACADEPDVPLGPVPATLAELTGAWRAAPLSLDQVMWSTIEGACRRDIEFPAGAHALHIEVRGGGVAIVRMTGAQSGACDALQITPDGRVNGAGGGQRSEAAERWLVPPGNLLGPIQQQTVEGGDLKFTGWSVSGPVGAGIQTVIVQPLGQPQIVATVMNGWFSAWWPAQLADPNAPAGRGLQPHLGNMPAVTIQGLDVNGEVVNQIRG
jgi:hypothetical protein